MTVEQRKKQQLGAYQQGLLQGTVNAIKDPEAPYFSQELIEAWVRGWEEAQQARAARGFSRQPPRDLQDQIARGMERGRRLWGDRFKPRLRVSAGRAS